MEYGAGLQDQYRAEENQTGPEEDSYQYSAGAFSSNSQAFVAFDPAMEGQGYWEGSLGNEMNWEVTEENSTEPGEGSYQ
ncbi:hypothetical protein B0H10DRAFT_2211006 [Mycena sp. CBHHK59/15]|nr:hypothetical protein B0H10DRAFT_2211006 [Mycena sp. CBHHK59/15]